MIARLAPPPLFEATDPVAGSLGQVPEHDLDAERASDAEDGMVQILLIEDNPADVALVREVLAEDPNFVYTLRDASSLKAARAILESFTPDVLLSDLSLPDGQGLETFRKIAAWGCGAPVVILSGLDDKAIAVEAVREGAQDYIPKSEVAGITLSRVLRYAIERSRTERAIAARERRWRAMIERSTDVVALVDEELCATFVSDSIQAASGLSPADLVGRPLLDFVHPKDHATIAAALRDTLENEPSAPVCFRFRGDDGSWTWWEAVATNLLGDPAVGAIVVNARDISARKAAEATSERHKRILQMAMDALPGVFYLFDETPRMVLWNGNLEVVTRHSAEELAAIDPLDLVVERAEVEAAVRSAFETGSATVEAHLRGHDGEAIPYLFTGRRCVLDHQPYVVGVGLDLSEQRAAQQHLQFHASLLAKVSNAVIATDHVGRIEYWNPGAEQIYGWTRDEALGRAVTELTVPAEHASDAAVILEQVARTGEWEGEFLVRDKSGEIFPSWTTLTRVTGKDGGDGFLGVSVDIRERKQAEEERKALLEQLGERVKELRLLHEASLVFQDESAALGHVFERLARRIPAAWQRPSATAVRIRYEQDGNKHAVASEGFRVTPWHQIATFETSGPGLGTIEVAYLEPPPAGKPAFLDEEVAVLESLTQMLGAYLDRRHVRERNEALTHSLTAQISRLGTLEAISEATLSGLGLKETYDVILEETALELQVDAVDLLLFDSVEQRLHHAASRGFRHRSTEGTSLRLGEGMGGRSALERKAIAVPDVRAPGIAFEPSDFIEREGFVSYYSMPLIAKGRLQGLIGIFHRSPLAFPREWRDVAHDIAQHAAIAIDNAVLFEDLQRSNTELQLSYDRTIEGWARALDLKDEETAGHSQRVTQLTVALARKLGIAGEALANIRRGALLHDIGKMGVPDRILLKPGKLDDEEWEIMKRHTTHARDLLVDIPFLTNALEIPYAHHERWDGAGYPRGLVGEDIPLAARIFAVVDVYDALTSDRPYRAAWSREDALSHISAQTGSHFDPKVVEAFLAHLDEAGTTPS